MSMVLKSAVAISLAAFVALLVVPTAARAGPQVEAKLEKDKP